MPATARFRFAAVAAVGTVLFGAGVAAIGRRLPADPRITAAGLLTAGILAVALLLMVWARRRTGPQRPLAPRRARATADSRGGTGLTVIPLGDDQAAVVWDEAEPALRPRPEARPHGGPETAAAADAIWAAVEVAVRDAQARSGDRPPAPDGDRPEPPRRQASGRRHLPWRRPPGDRNPPESR